MRFLICGFVLALCSRTIAGAETPAEAALRECGNLHHLEFRNLPNAKGEYSNSQCTLKCEVGEKILSQDAVNEGFPCPGDASGICNKGQCVGTHVTPTEAQRECGNLHHMDFHQSDTTGTQFTNSHCSLTCMLNRNLISTNALDEGYPCPQNPQGICRSGICVSETGPLTTPKPTVPGHAKSILDKYKIDKMDLNIFYANLSQLIDHSMAYACVKQTPRGSCIRTCQTKYIIPSTSNPHYDNVCTSWNGDAHLDRNIFTVDLYKNTGTFHKIAHYQETIGQLWDRLYNSDEEPSPNEYRFEVNVPVSDAVHVAKNIGEIFIEFKFKLSKRV